MTYYKLNDRDEAIAKSTTQLEGYLPCKEDYDISIYNVTFGTIDGDGNLIVSKKVIKPSAELAKLVVEDRQKIADLEATVLGVMDVVAGGKTNV